MAASAVCLGLVLGCQSPLAPGAPTLTQVAISTPEAVGAQAAPRPTLAPRPTSAAPPPTVAPPTAAPSTAVPTSLPMPAPTATVSQPVPTPDAARLAQQHYCDIASPPAHLPLPPIEPSIHISQAETPTQPPPLSGGPRQELADPAPQVSARNVAVVDEGSGNLLFGLAAFERRAPASITKIATTIVALERGPDISATYATTVSATYLVPCDGSSVMGLEPNGRVKLETLLFGMMLPSGNDAAEQVAVSLGGSRERYVDWMNGMVAALHLRDTHFVSPSGMDADEHYTSAYDMAMISRYAMQNAEFRRIAATTYFVSDEFYMQNLNPLLNTYPGADGVKIGYTDVAGRTIVGSATRDGHRVIVALLGSRNLAGDCIALFEWVWKTYRW